MILQDDFELGNGGAGLRRIGRSERDTVEQSLESAVHRDDFLLEFFADFGDGGPGFTVHGTFHLELIFRLGSENDAGQVWKDKLLPYHSSVVKAIREYDKDNKPNIVICGTDNWSQFVDAPLASPVKDPAVEDKRAKTDQIMYTMHFYAGTHDVSGSWLKDKVNKALKGGIPVFVTEWGTSEASGDGGPYIAYARKWLKFLDKNKISRCAWSLSNKNEISAAFKPSASASPSDHNRDKIPDWKSSELSKTGKFLRSELRKVKKGDIIRAGNFRFKVLSSGTVKYAGVYRFNATVRVPSSIKYGGKTYKVKRI